MSFLGEALGRHRDEGKESGSLSGFSFLFNYVFAERDRGSQGPRSYKGPMSVGSGRLEKPIRLEGAPATVSYGFHITGLGLTSASFLTTILL